MSITFVLLINLKLLTLSNSFLLIIAEHEISMLINMKMPTNVGFVIFISRENYMLSWVEYEKSFIRSGLVIPYLYYVNKHTNRESPDQILQMPSLFWAFIVRIQMYGIRNSLLELSTWLFYMTLFLILKVLINSRWHSITGCPIVTYRKKEIVIPKT